MILHLAAALGLRMLLTQDSAPAPRVFLDDGAGRVAPERVVTIRWAALPADARECELLLEVDGGRGRLRITDELDPRAGSYRWTVPNVPVHRARIVLRVNRDGREIEIAPSEPFAIGAADDAPRAAVFERAGEIWLTDAGGEEGEYEPEAPRSTLARSVPAFVAPVAEYPAALPPPAASLQAAPPAAGPLESASIRPARGPARPVFGLSAHFVPPRI